MTGRPPRTDAHRQRDAYLQQFADLGLVPILSTNGSHPNADIQFVKVPADEAHSHADLFGGVECWITERGAARLRGDEVPE